MSLFYNWAKIRCSNSRNSSRKMTGYSNIQSILSRKLGLRRVFEVLAVSVYLWTIVYGRNLVFRNDHYKEFSPLLLLDLFSYWNSIIVTDYQAIRASGTVQRLKTDNFELFLNNWINRTLTKESIVNFLDSLKIMKMNQLSFFIFAQQTCSSTQVISTIQDVVSFISETHLVQ